MVVRFLLLCFFSYCEGPAPSSLPSFLVSLFSSSFKYCSLPKYQFRSQKVNPFQNNFPVNGRPTSASEWNVTFWTLTQAHSIRISSSEARNLHFNNVPRWFQCSLKPEKLFCSLMAHPCSRYCQYPDSIIQPWVLPSGSPIAVCFRVSWKTNTKSRGPVSVDRAFVGSPSSPRWPWLSNTEKDSLWVWVGGGESEEDPHATTSFLVRGG